jgi:hypothetical protein
LFRYFGTQSKDKGAQWSAIAWTAIAYGIWLYTLGKPVEALGVLWPPVKRIYDPNFSPLLLLIFGAVVPYFYKGDEDPRNDG